MSDRKQRVSGWGIALAGVAGVTLGSLSFASGGCDAAGMSVPCGCPLFSSEAVVHLSCLPSEPPVVTTTGPCSACPVALADGSIPPASCISPGDAHDLNVAGSASGTCHVTLTFAGGATSSVDLDFTSVWHACGDDPHGCGETLGAATATVSPPAAACGALDAALTD